MASKACLQLEEKVMSRDLCTLCGACVGMCPYIVAYQGRVLVRDECDLSEGRCSAFCPRISLDLNELSRLVFGIPYGWEAMGSVSRIFMARSSDRTVRTRAQDAGTVTSLMGLALEEGLIDSAVVTSFQDKAYPEARVVSDRQELLKCAGSNYMASPTLQAFHRAAADAERSRIGVVATPCQTLGLAKMRTVRSEEPNGIEKLKLVIGLFCTWALSYPAFEEFLEKEVSRPVLKYKIPPPPANVLQVVTPNGQIDLPLDRIRPLVRPACKVCWDMTSEFADLSVGAAELEASPGGGQKELSSWNTVIVRTERGMSLLERARIKGILETEELPKKSLDHLREAARNKKKRALQAIVEKTGSKRDLLCLKVDPSAVERFLEE